MIILPSTESFASHSTHNIFVNHLRCFHSLGLLRRNDGYCVESYAFRDHRSLPDLQVSKLSKQEFKSE